MYSGMYNHGNFIEGVSENFFRNILSNCELNVICDLHQELSRECEARESSDVGSFLFSLPGSGVPQQEDKSLSNRIDPNLYENNLNRELLTKRLYHARSRKADDEQFRKTQSSVSRIAEMGGIHGLMKILTNTIGKYPISSFWKRQEYTLRRELSVLETQEKRKVKKNKSILQPSVLEDICVFLNPMTISNASITCRKWNQILSMNRFWKKLYLNHSKYTRKAEIRSYKEPSIRKRVKVLNKKFGAAERRSVNIMNWKAHYATFHIGVHLGPKNGLYLNRNYLKKKDNVFLPYFALYCLSSISRYDKKFALQIITNKEYERTIMKYLYFGFTWLENYIAAKLIDRVSNIMAEDTRIWEFCTQPKIIKIMLFLLEHCEDVVFREFIQFPEHRDKHVEKRVFEMDYSGPDLVNVPVFRKNEREEKELVRRCEQVLALYADHPRDFIDNLWRHDPNFAVDLCEKYDLFSVIYRLLTKEYVGGILQTRTRYRLNFFKELMIVKQARECLLRNKKMCKKMIDLVMRFLQNASTSRVAVDTIVLMCRTPELVGKIIQFGYAREIEDLIRHNCLAKGSLCENLVGCRDQFMKLRSVKVKVKRKFTGWMKVLESIAVKATLLTWTEKERSFARAQKKLEEGSVLWRKGQERDSEQLRKKAVESLKDALLLCPDPNPEDEINVIFEKSSSLSGVEDFKIGLCGTISSYLFNMKDYENCIRYSVIGTYCYTGEDSTQVSIKVLFPRIKARFCASYSAAKVFDGYCDIEACLNSPRFEHTIGICVELNKMKRKLASVKWIPALQRKWGVRMPIWNVKEIDKFMASLEPGFIAPVMFVGRKGGCLSDLSIIEKKGRTKKKKKCAYCGRNAGKTCSGCNKMSYCSRECQVKHWKSGHKAECKKIKKNGM